MAIFLGVFAVLLVLFMVFAMALAEWADMDPGEWFARLRRGRSPAAVPAAASALHRTGTGPAPAPGAAKPSRTPRQRQAAPRRGARARR